jgi:hypothetical protein
MLEARNSFKNEKELHLTYYLIIIGFFKIGYLDFKCNFDVRPNLTRHQVNIQSQSILTDQTR